MFRSVIWSVKYQLGVRLLFCFRLPITISLGPPFSILVLPLFPDNHCTLPWLSHTFSGPAPRFIKPSSLVAHSLFLASGSAPARIFVPRAVFERVIRQAARSLSIEFLRIHS